MKEKRAFIPFNFDSTLKSHGGIEVCNLPFVTLNSTNSDFQYLLPQSNRCKLGGY